MIERLRLRVVEIDRRFHRRAELPRGGVHCHGDERGRISVLRLGPHLRHTILLSGFFGGGLWGLKGPVSRTGQQDDTSGGSMADFGCAAARPPSGGLDRLREPAGAAAAMPFRGDESMADRDRLRAPERSPVVEESGVPRGAFGTSKRATAISFNMRRFGGQGPPWTRFVSSSVSTSGHGATGSLIGSTDSARTCAFTTFFAVRNCASWSASRDGSTTCARGWSRAFIAWSDASALRQPRLPLGQSRRFAGAMRRRDAATEDPSSHADVCAASPLRLEPKRAGSCRGKPCARTRTAA